MEPVEVADFITRNTTLVTEGMGCGGFATGSTSFPAIFSEPTPGAIRVTPSAMPTLRPKRPTCNDCGPTRFAPSPDVRSAGYPDRWHEIHVAKKTS
jgi:hypothetical protein